MVGSARVTAVETEFDRAYARLFPACLAEAERIRCTPIENKLLRRAFRRLRAKTERLLLQGKYDGSRR